MNKATWVNLKRIKWKGRCQTQKSARELSGREDARPKRAHDPTGVKFKNRQNTLLTETREWLLVWEWMGSDRPRGMFLGNGNVLCLVSGSGSKVIQKLSKQNEMSILLYANYDNF